MKKLFAMLLALCLMCGMVNAIAEDVFINTSYFTIADSYLKAMFNVKVEEDNDINNAHPVSVEGESTELNRYFKMNVFRYTDDVLLGGQPITWWVQFAVDSKGLTPDARAKTLCSCSYNVALEKAGLAQYEDSLKSRYVYLGNKGQLFCVVTIASRDLTFAMCHNETFGVAYVFEVGILDPSKEANLNNELIATMLVQYMEEAHELHTTSTDTGLAEQYVIITNSSANIRAKADSKSDRITTAKQGDTFLLLGEEGTWYKIEVNGQTAYVSQGLCKIKE